MKRRFPLIAAFLLSFAFLSSGCEGYYSRSSGEAIEKAETRAKDAEHALQVVTDQKDKAEKAKALADAALAAAQAAGAKDAVVAELKAAADKAKANMDTAFAVVAAGQKALSESNADLAAAKAKGEAKSPAEIDSQGISALLKAIGGFFGPEGLAAGTALGWGYTWLQKRISDKKAAAGAKVVKAVDVVKKDAGLGGVGVVNFGDPATIKRLNEEMEVEGKEFVDSAQPY